MGAGKEEEGDVSVRTAADVCSLFFRLLSVVLVRGYALRRLARGQWDEVAFSLAKAPMGGWVAGWGPRARGSGDVPPNVE